LVCFQSGRNLGDTAILAAAVRSLRSRRPHTQLTTVTPTHDGSLDHLGISWFGLQGNAALGPPPSTDVADPPRPRGRAGLASSILAVYRFAGSIDALVFSGGGQLDDFWGGPSNAPLWIFIWAACARVRRVPISFLGVGVDRISSPLSRWLIRRSLQMSSYCSVRDAGSLSILREAGACSTCVVCPDLAFGLQMRTRSTAFRRDPRRYVVVTPASFRMWSPRRDSQYERYLESMAALCRHLALAHRFHVRLLSTQEFMDTPALEEILRRLGPGDSSCTVERVNDLASYLDIVRDAELVVSSRLHGLILPLVAGVPVIAVSPMRKMRQLMHDMALEEYCLNMFDIQTPLLLETADRLLEARGAIKLQIERRVEACRSDLEKCYDSLDCNGLLGP